MNITRSIAVVALGVFLFLVTWWVAIVFVSTIGVHYDTVADSLPFLSGWVDLIHTLMPGIVVGYLATSRPALHSAVSAALGALTLSLYSDVVFVAAGLNGMALAGVTGAVAGLAGAHIRGRSS